MRSSRFLIAIFVLAALAGCQQQKKPRYLDDGKDKTGAKMLASGEFIPPAFGSPQGAWRLTHIDGKPTDRGRIEFAKGWIGAGGGCNRMGGEYVSHLDGRIRIKDMSGTLMACSDADGGTSGMALDDLIWERLGRAVKFQRLTSDDLLLTTSDNRSLRMARLPRPPRSVEGDWALLGSKEDRSAPRPTAHFHRGRYHDAVGCAGRFWQAFGFLHLTLDETPACKGGALTAGPHKARGTYFGFALYPRDNGGLQLAPLSNWERTPRSQWTLDGLWYGDIREASGRHERYRFAFSGGRVSQWENCQGDFNRRGDRLSFVFPNTKGCRARPATLPADYWAERTQLPPGVTAATLRMRSYGEIHLTFADGKTMWIYRVEPKERRPASSGGR
jgi:heat shock protein HslJ